VAFSCEHGNELMRFIRDRKVRDWPSDCQLLRKDPAPWSRLDRTPRFSLGVMKGRWKLDSTGNKEI
jgi:hypothetical protein